PPNPSPPPSLPCREEGKTKAGARRDRAQAPSSRCRPPPRRSHKPQSPPPHRFRGHRIHLAAGLKPPSAYMGLRPPATKRRCEPRRAWFWPERRRIRAASARPCLPTASRGSFGRRQRASRHCSESRGRQPSSSRRRRPTHRRSGPSSRSPQSRGSLSRPTLILLCAASSSLDLAPPGAAAMESQISPHPVQHRLPMDLQQGPIREMGCSRN
ncbi:unnamed protein product, partial [Urochloa humidicola]